MVGQNGENTKKKPVKNLKLELSLFCDFFCRYFLQRWMSSSCATADVPVNSEGLAQRMILKQ